MNRDSHFIEIADALAGNEQLKSIAFAADTITKERLGLLAEGLRSNSVLEELLIEISPSDRGSGDWQGFSMPNELSRVLASRSSSLVRLMLAGLQLTPENFKEIADALSQTGKIQSLHLEVPRHTDTRSSAKLSPEQTAIVTSASRALSQVRTLTKFAVCHVHEVGVLSLLPFPARLLARAQSAVLLTHPPRVILGTGHFCRGSATWHAKCKTLMQLGCVRLCTEPCCVWYTREAAATQI